VFVILLKSEGLEHYKTRLNGMKIRLEVYPKYSLTNFIFNFMIGKVRIQLAAKKPTNCSLGNAL